MQRGSASGCSSGRPLNQAARERHRVARDLLREASLELARLRRVRGAYRKTWRRIARERARIALAAAVLGAGVAEPTQAGVPIFDNGVFGLGVGGGRLDFADIDGDGDLDAFIGTTFFANTGTASAPAFGGPSTNPFGLANLGTYASGPNPDFADIDGDGDLDAFFAVLGRFVGHVVFFENTGTASAPAFGALSTNPFGLQGAVGRYEHPTLAFADIDGDGDLDAFLGGNDDSRVGFFENTGTASAPAFVRVFGAVPGLWDGSASPTFADIDGDGDPDGFDGIYMFENTGSATAPAFGEEQFDPFGFGERGEFRGVPEFADIDGDGDLDAFVRSRGVTTFFVNTGTVAAPAFVAPLTTALGLADVGFLASPHFADIDGDGDLDAFVGEYFGNTVFFANTGMAAAPALVPAATNPFGLGDVGRWASPDFVDIDGDGDLDAFVGEFYGNAIFFANTGTETAPAFAAPSTNPFGLADVGYLASPAFADIDGDGDLDAFVGESSGDTIFFANTGTANVPAFAPPATNPFGLARVGPGRLASPAFADLDLDGDLDAYVGNDLGNTIFFDNTGTVRAPAFAEPSTNPFGLAAVMSFASPDFADIDGDGDLDAFVGEKTGGIAFFEQVGVAPGACEDGFDNDRDGRVDFPADAGCASETDSSERSGRACDNGRDDDGDGRIDWRSDGSGDPHCVDLADGEEANQPPDCSTAATPLASLWPPDGRFAEVPIVVTEPDREPVSIRIDDIQQDEPTGGSANRISGADGYGIGSDLARVRAERSARGNGRVYHVGFTASDPAGLSCSGSVSVCVPHHRGASCTEDGPLYSSSHPPSLASSDPLPGAPAVARTAWIRVALTRSLKKPGAIELRCGGTLVPVVTTVLDSRTAVLNPTGELPPGAMCSVRYAGSRGMEEFYFRVAPGAGSETVLYDRLDLAFLNTFPDDYWLVDDPMTPSGKRVQVRVGQIPDPLQRSSARAIAAAIADRDGFSPIQDVVFSLSQAADAASFPADESASLDPAAPIGLFDMDPASPEFGRRIPFTLRIRSDVGPGGVVDHTGLLFPAVRLAPGGHYAFVVTRRLHAQGDPARPFAPSGFFASAAAAPAAGEPAEVARARQSIGPVLEFLASAPQVPIPPDDVALALSFSIRSEAFDPSDLVAIKENYLAEPPPALDVFSVTPGFGRAARIEGTVSLPLYLDPSSPIRLNRDPVTGRPTPADFDSVPFVLTLPDAARSGPVPVVMYQHGGGGSAADVEGSFNEFLDDAGYAVAGIQDYLNRTYGDLEAQGFASFLTLLGQRRFPLSHLQTYADMLGFLRALQGLGDESWLPLAAPDAIPEIDPARILFRGTSRGSYHSMAFLPLAPEIAAAVSVVGAGRDAEQFLHGYDEYRQFSFLSTGIPRQALWGFAALAGDLDRQDAHFLARHLYREPLAVAGQTDNTPPSLLLIEGIGDHAVSNTSTRAAAHELGIPAVRPVQQATPVLEQVDSPLAGNLGPGLTAGHFQYDPAATPSCRDLFLELHGHFCPQIALEAELQTLHFFETALDGAGPPEIIDPFLEDGK